MKIHQCSCQFCLDVSGIFIVMSNCSATKRVSLIPLFILLLLQCMKAYVEFEILEGAYEISCPDAQCPYQGIMDIEEDIATLSSHDLLEKHKRFRLNRGKFSRKMILSLSFPPPPPFLHYFFFSFDLFTCFALTASVFLI